MINNSLTCFLLLMAAGVVQAQSADPRLSRQDAQQLINASAGERINNRLAGDLSALFNYDAGSKRNSSAGSGFINIKSVDSPTRGQTGSVAQAITTRSASAALEITAQAGGVDQNSIRITSIPFTISQPGAYLLADNMTNTTIGADGITITTGQVTLDLGGFFLNADTVAGDDGIVVSGDLTGIRIHNGRIDGWGGDGINANSCDSCLFESLTISNNTQNGLLTGTAAVVKNVISSFNGLDGIDVDHNSVVVFSNAVENGDSGIQGSLAIAIAQSGSFVNAVHGIDVGSGSTITNSATRDNTRFGFEMGSASVVLQSSAQDNGETGFQIFFASMLRDNIATRNGKSTDDATINNGYRATANSYLINNQALDNGGAGIRSVSGDSVIESNMVLDNDRVGIEATGGGNFIVGNRASGNLLTSNPLNYDFAANNAFGPIVDLVGINDISTVANSDHIYANLEF